MLSHWLVNATAPCRLTSPSYSLVNATTSRRLTSLTHSLAMGFPHGFPWHYKMITPTWILTLYYHPTIPSWSQHHIALVELLLRDPSHTCSPTHPLMTRIVATTHFLLIQFTSLNHPRSMTTSWWLPAGKITTRYFTYKLKSQNNPRN